MVRCIVAHNSDMRVPAIEYSDECVLLAGLSAASSMVLKFSVLVEPKSKSNILQQFIKNVNFDHKIEYLHV